MYTTLRLKYTLFTIFFVCTIGTDLWAQIGIPGAINYTSYRPIPGEKYVISGWVYEVHESTPLTYTSFIRVSYTDEDAVIIATEEFTPSGAIIDNWQRIIGEFTIPTNAVAIKIELVYSPNIVLQNPPPNLVAYFDDIRVHPFNGNLKSFVYDPATQRLLAELDENNYATYYDYDREGGLVRVKKETEKGVYTIQETRSSTRKIDND